MELNMLRGIQSASSLIGFLMDDLLDRQLLENGNFTAKLQFFNIKEAIMEVLSVLEIQTEARGNKVTVDLHKHVPFQVRTDKNRMQQVLLNLITNANKFQSNKDIKIFCCQK